MKRLLDLGAEKGILYKREIASGEFEEKYKGLIFYYFEDKKDSSCFVRRLNKAISLLNGKLKFKNVPDTYRDYSPKRIRSGEIIIVDTDSLFEKDANSNDYFFLTINEVLKPTQEYVSQFELSEAGRGKKVELAHLINPLQFVELSDEQFEEVLKIQSQKNKINNKGEKYNG